MCISSIFLEFQIVYLVEVRVRVRVSVRVRVRVKVKIWVRVRCNFLLSIKFQRVGRVKEQIFISI